MNRNTVRPYVNTYCRLRDVQYAAYTSYAKAHGLTTNELFVLDILWFAPDGCLQSDICRRMSATKQTISAIVKKFLKQGIQVCVNGRLQTRNYEDKNGIKRYVTEVIAEEIDFADSYTKIESNADNTQETVSEELKEKDASEDFISNGDDLPF